MYPRYHIISPIPIGTNAILAFDHMTQMSCDLITPNAAIALVEMEIEQYNI